jgi:L-alanine-DL-glutamate epimerase-like enolase superfamily enzyme
VKKTDVRILEARPYFPQAVCRTPLKFGAVVVESLAFCHVQMTVENRAGKKGVGWGAMFLMDMWGWPSPAVAHELRAEIMEEFVRRLCRVYEGLGRYGHPIELFHEVEPEFRPLAAAVCTERQAAEVMPYLCQLVAASPVDAAVHDAYGVANGLATYRCYGPEHMNHDLSRYLGREFEGRYVSDYLWARMPRRIPAFHLVGGLDKLHESEVTDEDPRDGLPVSLDQWVRYDHLHCLKVKLKGTDLDWDVGRIDEVVAIAHEEHRTLGLTGLCFSADTNEQCDSPEYIIELIAKLKERNPEAERELLYIEQPTGRDLRASRHDMHQLAKLKPVIIDESLMTLEDFHLARELGWSGVALKACKCQSAALLFACLAGHLRVPYTVQDLTNPGLALIQSVALAGHLRPLKGVEANSRQFFPSANEPESRVHPGVFKLDDGCIATASITGPGIGYRSEEVGRCFLGDV